MSANKKNKIVFKISIKILPLICDQYIDNSIDMH